MKSPEGNRSRRISVDLPENLITRFDELKREWGLRGRGAVLERLLEVILPNEQIDIEDIDQITSFNDRATKDITEETINNPISQYDENTALVLISKAEIVDASKIKEDNAYVTPKTENKGLGVSSPGGIDLPGFVRRSTENLRQSLNHRSNLSSDSEPLVAQVRNSDISESLESANKHWLSLYGHEPGEAVIEAAMIWLAREIWNHSDQTIGEAFTWSLANKKLKLFCSSWSSNSPSFERIMVVAGVLEDPFAVNSLPQRMPTLIRRFVNQYKRRRNATSFETIETTMTVHGALKLLDLPTKAGSALTLSKVREAYKNKAIKDHPDAGGSTESMRRINEAYQLLKELYRNQ